MKKSLIALAFGTLALGIAEFAMMGILPSVASDLGISISTAGHFISAYALGVCGGAPILLWARKYSLKHILIGLVVLMAAGNLCAAFSSGYWMLLLSRFVSGLPHGAYFGVASIVAGKLADEGRGSEAVSIMIAGMTVANLFGVPLGTSFSHLISWRVTFLLVGCWGIIVLYYIWRWIPHVEALQDTGFKGQFRFLKKPAPWLILGATALGNGGVFCWYSYITPLLTQVSGFSAESVTPLMVLAGFGMVVGNLVSGRLSDRYTPGRVGTVVLGILSISLVLVFFFSSNPWCSALLMALCTAGLFAVSGPEQVLIIRVAPGGEMLGGAAVQIAFNLGNAVGAYVGGLAVTGGYRYPALAGVPFVCVGFLLFLVFYKKYQKNY
ncbi:MFS transporter AraJ [Mediterranea sp. An20]|uniref:MFS transporter AraJ n=1 Tax=Mediterranea sp. An20 TaxID=1965586 RepID=UPI000B38CD6D|nr:MFS transporter AraJ [Mediterranea sp. An20]OUP06285.1 MFS transporter AraJ [Mediterranea sp. An20]